MDGGSGRGELGEIEIVVGRRINWRFHACWMELQFLHPSFVLVCLMSSMIYFFKHNLFHPINFRK
jgi:hypothetical protein